MHNLMHWPRAAISHCNVTPQSLRSRIERPRLLVVTVAANTPARVLSPSCW